MKFKAFMNRGYKILCLLMLFLWSKITFDTIFAIYDTNMREMRPLTLIIGTIVSLMIFVYIMRKLKNYDEKKHNKIAYATFIIVFFIMLLWGSNIQALPTYDLSHVVDQVNVMLKNHTHIFGANTYFSIYPNQVPLALFIYSIEALGSLFHMANPGYLMIVYNAFMTSFSLLIIYKIVKKLFGSTPALIAMFMLAVYPDFYLFVTYYYSDILSLPFSVLGYYFLLKSESGNFKKESANLLLAGIMFAMGFKLRVVTAILFIAYIIDTIGKNNLKVGLKRAGIALFGFVFFIGLYNKVYYPIFKVETDKTITLPAIHWVMMGLDYDLDGGYTDADAMYSIRSLDKTKDIFAMMGKRLTHLDESFFSRKISRVWSTGDHDILRKYGMMNSYGTIYYYLDNKPKIFIRYLAQIMKITIYFLFLITIGKELGKKKDYESSKVSTIIIAIFGAIVFYLIWEALNRYSFTFLPWILIAAVPSIAHIDELVQVKTIKIDKFSINFQEFRNIVSKLLVVITGILLTLNLFKYCIFTYKLDFDRIVQDNNTKNFIPVIDNDIVEEFRLADDFNRIQLQVYTSTITRLTVYNYEIYDENHQLLREGTYEIIPGVTPTKDNPVPTRNINLVFEPVEVSEEGTYYMRFFSNEASTRNYLSVNSFVLHEDITDYEYFSPEYLGIDYDVNPRGKTYVDGELLDGSLRLRISLRKRSTIMPVYVFLIFSMGVMYCIMISVKVIKGSGKHETK